MKRLPSFAPNDRCYCRTAYAESLREATNRCRYGDVWTHRTASGAMNIYRSDFTNLIFRKYDSAVDDSFCLPVFLNLVALIIALRANKQVSRIDTGWVIALVEDAHFGGDSTFVKFPRESMGLSQSFMRITNHECSVSLEVFSSHPFPATIARNRRSYVGKESLLKCPHIRILYREEFHVI